MICGREVALADMQALPVAGTAVRREAEARERRAVGEHRGDGAIGRNGEPTDLARAGQLRQGPGRAAIDAAVDATSGGIVGADRDIVRNSGGAFSGERCRRALRDTPLDVRKHVKISARGAARDPTRLVLYVAG